MLDVIEDLQHLDESLELVQELLDRGADAPRWPQDQWLAWHQELAGHIAGARSEAAGLLLLADRGEPVEI